MKRIYEQIKTTNKKLWVQALRSGEYQQGKCALNNKNSFCCLGVLCDLHRKETNGTWTHHMDGVISYLSESNYLPYDVVDWATSEYDDESFFIDKKTSLVSLNDAGITFKEIADVIEKKF